MSAWNVCSLRQSVKLRVGRGERAAVPYFKQHSIRILAGKFNALVLLWVLCCVECFMDRNIELKAGKHNMVPCPKATILKFSKGDFVLL